MIGAISGDICGSPYEGGSCAPDHLQENSNYRFKFFGNSAGVMDDTVCTVAVAEALLTDQDFAGALRKWVARYPGRGYGGRFNTWATSVTGPYNSFGNGGAMRVSPCALLAQSLEEVERLALASAQVTHNHVDGIRGAQAVAAATWWAGQGADGETLRRELQARFGYDFRESVECRAQTFHFSTLASETVPDALVCAIEATSWRQAITNAVWIGGDSDTLACMAGGIAEARFGMPATLASTAMSRLPPDMQDVLSKLYGRGGFVAPWEGSLSEGDAAPEHKPDFPAEKQGSIWSRLQGKCAGSPFRGSKAGNSRSSITAADACSCGYT
jgi:ADP-ribosyl-[dinitrogen reductase] hydrolase